MFLIFSDDFDQGLCWPDMFTGTPGEGGIFPDLSCSREPVTFLSSFPSVSLQSLWELPGCNLKLTPILPEGRERLKKREEHFRLIGGRFNKQGGLLARLVLGNQKTSSFPHLPARIFKVYIEALTGVGYAHRDPEFVLVTYPLQVVSTPHYYLKAVSLGRFLHGGSEQSIHSKGRGGV